MPVLTEGNVGRREKDIESVTESDADVLAQLSSVEKAFADVGYPNVAMRGLAELAMLEYRKADRAIDRSKWFSSLLQVAKVCGNLGEEELEQRNMQISESARPVPQPQISVWDVDLTGFDE
jgi:hypothetical protein